MELNFADGVESYDVNGVKDVLQLNPTDAEMLREIYLAMKVLESKQNERDKPRNGPEDTEGTLNLIHDMNQEMRSVLDGIFGDGVCEKIFGKKSLYASAENSPIWLNFLLAVIDLFDDSVKREAALSDKRIQKHVQKYHR